MKLNMAALAGGNNPDNKRERPEHDFYATPSCSITSILKKVILTGTILEPACGDGTISKILRVHYPHSIIVSTDLIYRGYGVGDVDFLTHDFGQKYDNIITNPPFKYAKEFIEKGLEWSTDKVVMFAKIQLLEGKSRFKMFEKSPLKYVYVHSERQSPWMNGNPLNEKGKKWNSAMCFAWFVFQHKYKGEPIIRWL